MSTPEKIVQGGVGAGLFVYGAVTLNPQLGITGALLVIGALTPDQKPPQIADLQIGSLVTGTDPVGDRRVIYGQTRVGGVITYMGLRGGNNEYLNLVVTVAGHEVESIDALYLNDELVPLDSNGDATGKYAGYVHAEFKLGATDQTVLTGLRDSTYPSWLGGTFKGLRLDGMGNYCAAAADTAFNLATMTLEIYARPLAYQQGVIASLDGGTGWKLEYLADGRIRFTDGAGVTLTSSAQEPASWKHVAVEASAAGMTLYLDAVAVASTATAFTNGGSGAVVLRVGSLDGDSEFFCGDVDDLQIWDVLRGVGGIALDGARASLGGATSHRVIAIPFDDGSGTTADDNEVPEHDLTLYPSWTDDHRQRGCAYFWLRLKWNQTLFGSGLPNATVDIHGKKVRDPRTSPPTVAWSDLASLAQADYLTDTDFGVGADVATIDDDLLAAAANVDDEDVDLNDGASPPATQKRYTINGSFTTDQTPQAVLTDMFSASQGYLRYVGGVWGILSGAYRTPTVTLTESDLRDVPEIVTLPGAKDNFNAVKGVYPGPNNNYQPGDMPPVTNATYEAEDGGERTYLDTSFPFTPDAARAQRLGKIILEKMRQPMTVHWRGRLSCFQNQPGDVVLVTWDFGSGSPVWVDKPFEVIEGQFVVYGDVPTLGYDLLLRETASTVYDWSQEETVVDPAPNSLLPNPFIVLPPENLALESGTAALGIRGDGTVFSRIHATWDAPLDEFVTSQGRIEVQYRLSGLSPEASWIPHEFTHGAVTESFILDVIDGTVYDVRVRSVNAAGAVSPWDTVTGHTVVGKTAPPEDVTGFACQQNGTNVIFSWDQVGDLDLAGYETRFAAVGVAWENANRVTRVTRGTKITDAAIPPGAVPAGGARQPWRFFIKAFDTSGNESVTAATFDLLVVPAYDAIYQVEQWPAWNGTLSNLRRNPLTGNIRLESQSLAADLSDADLWGYSTPDPYASGTYTAPEIDTGGDDRVRIWSEISGFMAAGETGVPNAILEVDSHESSGAYDGFEPWTIGEATAEFVLERITLEAADGVEILDGFKVVVDLLEHSETVTVAIAQGGTDVAFTRTYRLPPQVVVNSADDGGSPATTEAAQFAAVTETGFRAWVLSDPAGDDIGGNLTYTATGV